VSEPKGWADLTGEVSVSSECGPNKNRPQNRKGTYINELVIITVNGTKSYVGA
jgi:hypothetical protein